MRRKRQPPATDLVFPGYSDVTEIGGGAFATVYRAVEMETSRPVALKALKVSAELPVWAEAFEQEVKALGALSAHPNIVTLYRTLRTSDGRPALVLELCEGSAADRLRSDGRLPISEAIATAVKIAGALETAHHSGLLHRDVKPQNILITSYGEPALADFGVAALHAAAQGAEGLSAVTTLHAPPEVLEGRQLSAATDVYGLASTLYQLITGRAPFAAYEGETPASLILRILRDPVAPLSTEGVPLSLSDLLGAALAKDAGARPPTPAAFAESLHLIEDELGRPPTPCVVWGGSASSEERARGGWAPVVSGGASPAATGGAAPPEVGTPAEAGVAPAASGAPPARTGPGELPPQGAPADPAPPARPGVVTPVAGRRNVLLPPTPGRSAGAGGARAAGGHVRRPALPARNETPPPGPRSPVAGHAPAPAPRPPAIDSPPPLPGPQPSTYTPADEDAHPTTPLPENPYEQTLTASGLFNAHLPKQPPPEAGGPSSGAARRWGLLAGASFAFGVAVVVLILVALGII